MKSISYINHAGRLLLEYIMTWTNQFQIDLKNTHYVKVKDIIILIVHTNKYMIDITYTFHVFLLFVLYVLY